MIIEFETVVTRLREDIELGQLKKPDPQMDGKEHTSHADLPASAHTEPDTAKKCS
jgi:hypothetical protein